MHWLSKFGCTLELPEGLALMPILTPEILIQLEWCGHSDFKILPR